jgi:hypothetical protein
MLFQAAIADSAPGHFISPMIHSYPLGILSALFGASIMKGFPLSVLAKHTGASAVFHACYSW